MTMRPEDYLANKCNLPTIQKMFELYATDKRMFDFEHHGDDDSGFFKLVFSVNGTCSLIYTAHRIRLIQYMQSVFGKKTEGVSIVIGKNVHYVFPAPPKIEIDSLHTIEQAEEALMLWLLTLN